MGDRIAVVVGIALAVGAGVLLLTGWALCAAARALELGAVSDATRARLRGADDGDPHDPLTS